METIMSILPIILYILGGILLVVLIILSIKLIHTIDRMNKVVDDVEVKVKSLNGFFSAVDFITDTLSGLSDRIVDVITSSISNLFTKKRRKKSKEKEKLEDEEYGKENRWIG